MTLQTVEARADHHPISHEESLEVCLFLASEFADSARQVDDTLAPWMRMAVEELRAGGSVSTARIEELQKMGTV
ncbi:hypothetical protein HYU91_02695 [Candidatus Collierbacteria bacterium]|nr:hypothetical protein [Candidatus Collierbacteria bacterium]